MSCCKMYVENYWCNVFEDSQQSLPHLLTLPSPSLNNYLLGFCALWQFPYLYEHSPYGSPVYLIAQITTVSLLHIVMYLIMELPSPK